MPTLPQQTLDDIRKASVIKNLTQRQRTILSFLEQQTPKAIIAERLNLSKSRISQIAKEFESLGLIKKVRLAPERQGVRQYNQFYEISDDARAQLTGEHKLPVTSFHVHHIGIKYKITRMSGEPSIDKRIAGDPPKFWRPKPNARKRYAFWFPGKAGHPHVTLYIYIRTIVAWVDKGQLIQASTLGDAERIGDLAIQAAIDQFREGQRRFGVIIETDSGTKGKRHYGAMLRENHPDMQSALTDGLNCPGWHADKSPDDKLPGIGEAETIDTQKATDLENVINMAPELVKLPNQIRDIISPIGAEVSQLRAMMQGEVTMQTQYEQMVKFMTAALAEMAELRKEVAELRAGNNRK